MKHFFIIFCLGKLKDLQDSLFDKMKELNAARIQNLPLKAEVESLRALIDEEEKRLVTSRVIYNPITEFHTKNAISFLELSL